MNGLREFGATCRQLPAALKVAFTAGAAEAADQMLVATRRSTSQAAPGRRMNTGKGAEIGVRLRKIGDSHYLISAYGPYQLIERRTRPHVEPRKRRRQGRRVFMDIPNIGVRRVVHHPGTKGKHPFAKAVERNRRESARIVRAHVRTAIRQTFR